MAAELLTSEKHRWAYGAVVQLHKYTYTVDTTPELPGKTRMEFITFIEVVVEAPVFPPVQHSTQNLHWKVLLDHSTTLGRDWAYKTTCTNLQKNM